MSTVQYKTVRAYSTLHYATVCTAPLFTGRQLGSWMSTWYGCVLSARARPLLAMSLAACRPRRRIAPCGGWTRLGTQACARTVLVQYSRPFTQERVRYVCVQLFCGLLSTTTTLIVIKLACPCRTLSCYSGGLGLRGVSHSLLCVWWRPCNTVRYSTEYSAYGTVQYLSVLSVTIIGWRG